jgi:negative modulator of initiation of replication
MKTIEIEDDVFAALEKRVRGFGDTPSTVIRRLLAQDAPPALRSGPPLGPQPSGDPDNPFSPLLTSPTYLMANAGGRFFQILAFLHQLQGEDQFAQLETYRFGNRVYFARDPKTIENSGSSTNPKPIPGTRFFALSTLSNAAKRRIITDVLRSFNYPGNVIGAALATLPDSGIVKSRQFAYPVVNQ